MKQTYLRTGYWYSHLYSIPFSRSSSLSLSHSCSRSYSRSVSVSTARSCCFYSKSFSSLPRSLSGFRLLSRSCSLYHHYTN